MERFHWKARWTSLVVQRLRFDTANTVGESSVPGWGAKILHAAWHSQKIKRKKNVKKYCVHIKTCAKEKKFFFNLKIECAYKDHGSSPLSLFPSWQPDSSYALRDFCLGQDRPGGQSSGIQACHNQRCPPTRSEPQSQGHQSDSSGMHLDWPQECGKSARMTSVEWGWTLTWH